MISVVPRLLERAAELHRLRSAVERAAAGRGVTVLVMGEPGIGKTSLLQTFVAGLRTQTRVLAGVCEDLLTPRALGALWDIARTRPGPLAAALADRANPDLLPAAVIDELARLPSPTVLVIEDAHWADSATLDVLRHVARRISELPAVLILTYRDADVGVNHPLRGLLGGLAGAERLPLRTLSAGAVTELAADSAVDADALFRLTDGNPFFVTEVLASPELSVPPTVADAVLARVGKLSPRAQAALEYLAVAPTGFEMPVLSGLVDEMTPIAEAERSGVLRMRGNIVVFRHELARRAVYESMPASVRLARHADVLQLLCGRADSDPFQVLHHAAGAGDEEAIVRYGARAAREASRVGSHRQAALCYAQVLRHKQLLPLARQASLTEAYAWSLSNSNQLHAAAQAAALAVEAWRSVRAESQLVRALVALSRQQWLTEQTSAARESAEEALVLSQRACGTPDQALATLNLGGLLVLVDREEEGLPKLSDALDLAELSNAGDVAALCRNYRGSAHLQLGRIDGEEELRTSIAAARKLNNHEYVMRGYYNLVEGLWRLGRYDEASDYMDLARDYSQNRDFPVHSYMLDARRFRLIAMHGRWPEAVAGLRSLLDGQDDPGMIGRETLPILARLLVRQGHPDASQILAQAVEHAERADVLDWLVPTGLAWIERAWLTGRPEQANRFQDLLLDRTDRPGMSVQRGELLRYLSRVGYLSRPFRGCPPAYAAGLRGDWQTAAACWERAGNRYEQALELADSGEPMPTLEALQLLLDLGAEPAAALVRRRLRALGVARIPRRRPLGRDPNPAGLTDRQIEILRMLSTGISNAEIARRLVVSPRTVDHHVSAILQKLGVRSRREAANRLATLDAADHGRRPVSQVSSTS
jgi:DNA-binding CsgD family transcriptional regulator/tetratricopeptide (TPR) repeat protein